MALTLRKNYLLALVALNILLLPSLYIWGHPNFLYALFRPAPGTPLPVYGEMPFFGMLTQDGQSFGNPQMKGKYWVADFIFTRCQNQCPMMSTKFRALQTVLPADVGLASFSVDPEHDTPDVLKSYAGQYNAREAKWFFLTGSKEAIEQVVDALHLGRSDDPGMHSLRFVLLDKQLRVRGYYDSEDTESLGKMKADIESLRRER